ncbi:HD domain-containing protein [Candidatus Dependentiae bacterium]|nr:HD domain-containing protein [Candidatus Dependentiae bacterium]
MNNPTLKPFPLNKKQDKIIQKTKVFVKNKRKKEGSGHDWQHVLRVLKNAILIGENENIDMFIVQLAALLHDIADWKFHKGDENIGPQTAHKFLNELQIEISVINHVCQIIKNISFKGQNVKTEMQTKEGEVVQDADRLDAIGAIGIARTFAYGGFTKREIYNPEIKPQIHQTFEEYKNNQNPTINHFYEKLLLLKNRMNTKTGRQIAQERHLFMEKFLNQFYQEIEGKL